MQPNWIDAKVRKPVLGKYVLVTDGERVTIGDQSIYDGKRDWGFVYGLGELPKVTHWMPLPQPPTL